MTLVHNLKCSCGSVGSSQFTYNIEVFTRPVQRQYSGLLPPVNKTFYFSVGGRTCIRGNIQQMSKESARCYSWDKLMYKGYIGNLLPEEVRNVLRFLCAKYVFSTEINGQLVEVYSDKVMRERAAFQKM